jgi:carboxypeptidase PM20D1
MPAGTPLERFRRLLRIPTVAPDGTDSDGWDAFDAFRAALVEEYPRVHGELEREVVAGHSLLYRWRGEPEGDPLVLMAHYDVVPATDDGWTHPPFAAELDDAGVLWGRGTIDDKGELVAILEAVESLLADGFVPPRDVYLSFGHNEETYGSGARAIVALLAERGIRPGLVLDEGGAVVADAFPGLTRPAAAIGVSEKGLTDFRLSVEQGGGHASTPPRMAATVRLARAVLRLERHPFPMRLSPPVQRMLEVIGANSSGALGTLFRNVRFARGPVARVMARLGAETRAMVHTTMAVTQLAGSAASNVLAERATANVNVRIAIGSSVAETEEHLRRAIRDDLVRIEVIAPSEPSPVSPDAGPAWDAITAAVGVAFPDAVPVPYVMFAASDSRHFTGISDHVYRFSGIRLSGSERAALHAIDERIPVQHWFEGITFFRALIQAY